MDVSWLELRDFRSYHELRLEPAAGINVLVGPNAAGKTNLLEAAAYLASLRSFRGVPDDALIRDEALSAVVRGQIDRPASSSVIEVELPRAGRRRVRVNGQRPTRTTDLLGHVRAIVFLPDDLDVIKRGPAYRRGFLDSVAVQLWPGAYLDQQEYDKALRQRNTLLRQSGRDVDQATLAVWDERLSQAAGKLMERRKGTASAVRKTIADTYASLAGEPAGVELHYTSRWGDGLEGGGPGETAAQLVEALAAGRPADLERRVTTVGPHRDEPWFTVEGRDARTRCSQGEQRSLALSLRLASHRAVEAATGEAPLLLLDDVFSELDMERAGALAGLLTGAQTFVTTARREEVPLEGRVFQVGEGTVW